MKAKRRDGAIPLPPVYITATAAAGLILALLFGREELKRAASLSLAFNSAIGVSAANRRYVPFATDALQQIASQFDHLVGAGQTVAQKERPPTRRPFRNPIRCFDHAVVTEAAASRVSLRS